MAVTLFVSHAPADDGFAQALTQALVEAGVEAHAETFGPDQQTPRDEDDINLRDCAIFLPVLSRAALSSPRARAEARRFYDSYHDAFGRFMLPVLLEPLDLDDIWPFLQEYQRIEGPPGEVWSPDARNQGVWQWVTLVVPARSRTPSGALRSSGGPPLMQRPILQAMAPTPQQELASQTRPIGEALIALPSEHPPQTLSRGRNVLVISRIVVLILVNIGGGAGAALLLRGQSPQAAAVMNPVASATAASATPSATGSSTTTVARTPTATTTSAASPTSAVPSAQAAFVTTDSTTQGTWTGAYGGQGYLIAPNDNNHPYSKIPGYAVVSVNGAATNIWAGSTNDSRALQTPPNSGESKRIAACWRSSSTFTVDIAVADGQAHAIALYFLDWDSNGAPFGLVERVDAIDAGTGATLDSRTLGQVNGDANTADRFNGGKYLVWSVRDHVRFTITNLNSDAALSGVFFA